MEWYPQFTETASFIATPMKKHVAVELPMDDFFGNVLTEKLWLQGQNILYLLEI